MLTLSAGQAQTVRDYLLPQIEANRQFARMAIGQVPTDKLDVRPVHGGESIGDLLWYIASAFDVFLTGICDGKFPALPAKPAAASTAAFLAWDEEKFPVLLQRAALLGDEELLRPVTFGHLTRPAVDFMPIFLGNIAQQIGVLSAWMQLYAEPVATSDRPVDSVDGELSDAELAGVAGGVTVTMHYNPNNEIKQMTQAGLGSLLGDGGGGYGAVGAVGGLAMLVGIWGPGVATLLAGGAAGGYTAGAAILMFLSRF